MSGNPLPGGKWRQATMFSTMAMRVVVVTWANSIPTRHFVLLGLCAAGLHPKIGPHLGRLHKNEMRHFARLSAALECANYPKTKLRRGISDHFVARSCAQSSQHCCAAYPESRPFTRIGDLQGCGLCTQSSHHGDEGGRRHAGKCHNHQTFCTTRRLALICADCIRMKCVILHVSLQR